MFWSYFIGFIAISVGIYFFLVLVGSELLAQLVVFLVGIAALAGLATAVSRLEEQNKELEQLEWKLERMDQKLDRLLDRQESGNPQDGEHSGGDKL